MAESRPILLGSVFHRSHGMTPEQALSGYQKHVFGSERFIVPPEEADEFYEKSWGKKRARPWAEEFEEIKSTAKATPIDKQLHEWAMGHEGMTTTMSPYHKALDLRELTNVMDTQAEYNPVRLYRGAVRTPELDAHPDRPLSFTTDPNVAFSFAKTGNARGQVIKVEPGTVRGLDFEKYGVNRRTVGRNSRKESEWLVDPLSFR